MELLNTDRIQYKLLRMIHGLNPFSLRGDLKSNLQKGGSKSISCLIPASNRPMELGLLLEDLAGQTLPKEQFEVVVLNDGGGEAVRKVVDGYRNSLNIVYRENPVPHRILSDLRNISIGMSGGTIDLFLDDDTRIFQGDFLERSVEFFNRYKADVILVHGQPLYGLVKPKYCYLDGYSFATRCCLYRREIIDKIGGFRNGLNSYEDIELSIRLMAQRPQIYKAGELSYFHPPLYFDSMQKPLSIGQSIFQMRKHYSFLFWLLVYVNALRFLPYGLLPDKVCRQWSRISMGVFLYPFMPRSYYY